VTIDNLVISGTKRLSAEDARIEIKKHVSGVTFR